MKIISISRTISGNNFDNISATANLDDGEDPTEAAKALDATLHAMLNDIHEQDRIVSEYNSEKREAVSMLERALDFARNSEVPF